MNVLFRWKIDQNENRLSCLRMNIRSYGGGKYNMVSKRLARFVLFFWFQIPFNKIALKLEKKTDGRKDNYIFYNTSVFKQKPRK